MDILVYAAKKNINDLNTCINTYVPTTFYQETFDAAKIAGNDGTKWTDNTALYSSYQRNGNHNCFWTQPYCADTWSRIPTLPGGSECAAGTNPAISAEYLGFKVCGTNFTQGANCTWTVPTGATIARFQMWGSGGRSGSGCCCGGSTWGTNGAYSSIIIPVVAGCQYTLCASCGCATPKIWGSTGIGRTGPSYVQGFGLNNVCAMSGVDAAHWCIMTYDIGSTIWFSGCCRWTASDCFTGGACICNTQNDFCFSNSCASCGCIPKSCSNTTKGYGCSTLPLTSGTIDKMYGSHLATIPGLNGGMCFDTNYYGISRSAPVYGYNKLCAEETLSFQSGSTCGGLCCNHFGYDYRRYPGAGGTSVHVFGGCTAMCDPSGNLSCGGDIGRSGLVCVTYA
jgi:hypothetical protein